MLHLRKIGKVSELEQKPLIKRLEQVMNKELLLPTGEQILIAVSGGPDSIALLHILKRLSVKYKWELKVAHINHGLRGEESETDATFVEQVCVDWGIPCEVRRVDVVSQLYLWGHNLQTAARALRYEVLREIAITYSIQTIVTAHHGDDQVETLIMRMLQGTGPGGMAGIRYKSELFGLKLIRPLLEMTKEELLTYVKQEGLAYRIDSSNEQLKYFRNEVRHSIIPALLDVRPQVALSVRKLARMNADEDDFLNSHVVSLMESKVKYREGRAISQRELFIPMHIALQRRMIQIILRSLKLHQHHINYTKIELIREAILAETPTTLELHLGDGYVFRRSYETLEWIQFPTQPQQIHANYTYLIDTSQAGTCWIEGMGWQFVWRILERDQIDEIKFANQTVAQFDANELQGNLIIRSKKPGDRMKLPDGSGTSKLKELFINMKVPKNLRHIWPIVVDQQGAIIWVPGLRRASRALIREQTTKAIVIHFLAHDD